jgi:hypothetical protein
LISKERLETTVAAYTLPLPSDHIRHIGIEGLTQQIAGQHEHLQAPEKFPDGLNFPPFSWSKKLQRVILRLFGLVLKSQKRFNLLTTQTFEQVINVFRLTQKDVHLLRTEVVQLREKELELTQTVLKLYQQMASMQMELKELKQTLSAK